jgi:hypothetical protein
MVLGGSITRAVRLDADVAVAFRWGVSAQT